MTRVRPGFVAIVTVALCVGWPPMLARPAAAAELRVGPTQTLKLPSQAAAVAKPGDVIKIDPGEYVDCAVWKASGLTIQGTGKQPQQVVLTGKACMGQGLFVIQGNDVTVEGITFREATVPEHNGAGIKMNGDNLTVRNSRFERNENGILAGGSKTSTVRISDSAFVGNGACIGACAHGVYAGQQIALLEIDNSLFLATRVGHHIKSRAQKTVVRDSRVEDGLGGTSSYLIETPWGGDLLVEKCIMQKGPNATNHTAAIAIGKEGMKNPTASLVIRDNRFRNDMSAGTVFVLNETETPAELIDNHLVGTVSPLRGRGSVTP